MSMTDDPNVIDSATRRTRYLFAYFLVGVTVFLGFSIYQAAYSGVVQGPNVQPRAGPGAARGKVAGANAVPRPATRSGDLGETLAWIAVAVAAVALVLSFVVPWRIVHQSRWRMAGGYWSPPPARTTVGLFVDPEAIRSDTGKLAFVYGTQLVLGAAFNEGAAFLAALAYMVGKNPIALGVAILLLAATLVRLPTRAGVASWIDRQQEWLMQERRASDSGNTITGGEPRHRHEPHGERLRQPLSPDDRHQGPAALEQRPQGQDAPSGPNAEAIEPELPVLKRRPYQRAVRGGMKHSRGNRVKSKHRLIWERSLPAGGATVSADPDWPTLPVLDMSRSPGTRLAYRLPTYQTPVFGCLLTTLACNAVTAFFIARVVADGMVGSTTEWSVWLMLVLFVPSSLFALYLAGAELRVRPPTVEVSDHPLVPGRRYHLFLSLSERLKVKSLRVLLFCEESAHVGDEGENERRIVYEQQVIAQEQFEVHPGRPFEVTGELCVPAGAMHSFKGKYNQVRWAVVVRGDIAGRSVFPREFPIVVRPPTGVAQ